MKRQASARSTFPSCPSITAFPTVILPFTFLIYNNNQSTYGFLLHKPGGIHFCTKTGILILKTPPQNAAMLLYQCIAILAREMNYVPNESAQKLRLGNCRHSELYRICTPVIKTASFVCRMFFVCLYYNGTLRQIQEKMQ